MEAFFLEPQIMSSPSIMNLVTIHEVKYDGFKFSIAQRSAKVDAPGCVNAAGKLGQK